MVRLIIFDIGGVIIDFSEEMYASYISKRFGIPYRKFARALERYVPYMELGDEKAGDMEKKLAREFGLTVKELGWASSYRKLAKPKTNVINLARMLSRKYKVVLLTNVSYSRYIEARRLLRGLINERIFASCYLHMRKPSRRIYLHVLKALHVKPGEAVFIDNMSENVEGAKKVGIKALRFTSYAKLVKDLKRLGVEA